MIENVCGAGTFSFHYCDFDISFCLLGEKNLVCVIVLNMAKLLHAILRQRHNDASK